MEVAKPRRLPPIGGARIPQHSLITAWTWKRLRDGTIRQWTYWSERGPVAGVREHVRAYVVTAEDAP